MAVRLAESFIQESNHKYEKFMLGQDFDRDKMLEMFPTARTFPQIKIDGESIGGYNEFERIILEHV
jgi:glutaredoxin 3